MFRTTVKTIKIDTCNERLIFSEPDPDFHAPSDVDEKYEYLQEIGVPANTLAPICYRYDFGSAFQNDRMIEPYLNIIFDYYITDYTWSDAPTPYSSEWFELRAEVIANVVNTEEYGF